MIISVFEVRNRGIVVLSAAQCSTWFWSYLPFTQHKTDALLRQRSFQVLGGGNLLPALAFVHSYHWISHFKPVLQTPLVKHGKAPLVEHEVFSQSRIKANLQRPRRGFETCQDLHCHGSTKRTSCKTSRKLCIKTPQIPPTSYKLCLFSRPQHRHENRDLNQLPAPTIHTCLKRVRYSAVPLTKWTSIPPYLGQMNQTSMKYGQD